MTSRQNTAPPPQPQFEINTPDVTLTFIGWRQKVGRFSFLHLLYNLGTLADTRLWAYGEYGAFYQWYQTQYESSTYSSHTCPASHGGRISFYQEAALPLDRPPHMDFRNSERAYPLQESRQIYTCPTCSGSGLVSCSNCDGKGKCPPCKGNKFIMNGQTKKRCSACRGSGKCSRCQGSGKVKCSKCDGEGKLLDYQSKDYKWWNKVDDEQILPESVERRSEPWSLKRLVNPLNFVEKMSVGRLIQKTRKRGGSVAVASFSREEVLRTTGVINARIEDLVTLAKNRQQVLLQEIARHGTILFQEDHREYLPLSYINTSIRKRYGQYYVAGTQQHQETRPPKIPISLPKCVNWVVMLAITLVLLFYPVATWMLVAGISVATLAFGVNVWLIRQEVQQPPPRRWVVFDNHQHQGWQFSFLLAQAISKVRLGFIADPWFTTLLEPPQANSVNSRNSFLYTIQQGAADSRQQTEVILIGNRAQLQYANDVARLIASATRLIWVANGGDETAIDQAIVQTLGKLPEEARQLVEVGVIYDAAAAPARQDNFPDTRRLLAPSQFQMLALPLQQMCDETQSGFISEPVAQQFQELLDYSGLRPQELDTQSAAAPDATAQNE